MPSRNHVVEATGTALLVFFGAGVATTAFGFELTGSAAAAGILATALAFGLVLLALAYVFGPISGCHINPAVTLGFVASNRMTLREAGGYWVSQFAGGTLGAMGLWAILSSAPGYTRSETGLAANGWGPEASMIGIGAGGAFATEVVLTFVFVLVVLIATSRIGSPGFAGITIGLSLTLVHLIGIPFTGTSVNPARSLGPAIVLGGDALSQVWLFIVAPLVGSVAAALFYRYLVPADDSEAPSAVAAGEVQRTTATP